jgi:hypothetical protein
MLSGLGLTICREIARTMGGNVWLSSSELGKGTVFSFSVPTVELIRLDQLGTGQTTAKSLLCGSAATDTTMSEGAAIAKLTSIQLPHEFSNQLIDVVTSGGYFTDGQAVIVAQRPETGAMLTELLQPLKLQKTEVVIFPDNNASISDEHKAMIQVSDIIILEPIQHEFATAYWGSEERNRRFITGCTEHYTCQYNSKPGTMASYFRLKHEAKKCIKCNAQKGNSKTWKLVLQLLPTSTYTNDYVKFITENHAQQEWVMLSLIKPVRRDQFAMALLKYIKILKDNHYDLVQSKYLASQEPAAYYATTSAIRTARSIKIMSGSRIEIATSRVG